MSARVRTPGCRPLFGARAEAAFLAAALLAAAPPAAAQKNLGEYVQPGLQDLTASPKTVSKNDRELGKLKGLADVYRLSGQEVFCKEPGKVRLQGKKGLFTIRYIINGDRRLTEVPTLRIRKSEDISKDPGKGYSISDLGIITRAWVERVQEEWVRSETRDGRTLQVFEAWYRGDRSAKHTFWLDPATRTIVEHIAHHRSKRLPGFKKRLVYSDVQVVNGISLPTTVTVYNGDNKQAVVVRYESIKINTGLADSLFAL